MTTTASMPVVDEAPKRKSTLSVNIFAGVFIVALIFNLVLALVIYTFGVSTGYNGEPSFTWNQFWSSTTTLFGSVGSLLALIGILAVLGGILWLVHWNSTRNRPVPMIFVFLVGIVAGALIVPKIGDWMNGLGFSFVLPLALVLFTAFESLVAAAIAPHIVLSRHKRGINH